MGRRMRVSRSKVSNEERWARASRAADRTPGHSLRNLGLGEL